MNITDEVKLKALIIDAHRADRLAKDTLRKMRKSNNDSIFGPLSIEQQAEFDLLDFQADLADARLSAFKDKLMKEIAS